MSPRKASDDLEVEARIRAHLRQQMDDRGISIAELARIIGTDDGHANRLLQGTRGAIRPGLIVRICKGLMITPTRLLTDDPPQRYFREGDPQFPGKHQR